MKLPLYALTTAVGLAATAGFYESSTVLDTNTTVGIVGALMILREVFSYLKTLHERRSPSRVSLTPSGDAQTNDFLVMRIKDAFREVLHSEFEPVIAAIKESRDESVKTRHDLREVLQTEIAKALVQARVSASR